MVYKAADIKHLDLMDSLATSTPREADEVSVQEPRASFDENILKLCDGLRATGLGKHADALENKFITYKAAANTHLYRAHDEDGEDLINAAHPEGDVNMGDGEHGDVETILSKHKKIVDIIQKTPSGKLATYVKQCKIALGQGTEDVPGGAPKVVAPPASDLPVSQISPENIKKAQETAVTALEQAMRDIDSILMGHPTLLGLTTGYTWLDAGPTSVTGGNTFGTMLNAYKDNTNGIPRAILKIKKKTDLSSLDAAKVMIEKLIKKINDIKDSNKSKHPDLSNTLNTYLPFFYHVIDGLYTAMAYVRGDQEGVNWHSNQVMSSKIANTFKTTAAALQKIITTKPANVSPQLLNVYNEIEKYQTSCNELAAALSSLNKTMHISEVQKLPAWANSPFANEKVTSIQNLSNILKKDQADMISILTKYRS